ncbi:hypothetical protein CSV86_012150 [Pseudomonas putida CSV86]|uniref:Uncharacterized protein n=1 Tax=Pseudomonas bharatica CSV86 TaxID=1005395 RepID=A0A7K4EE51_9PSED|nr:hypothetical protein [Pseudomonas bharatica]NNJ15927.1 hypothetical protein [Pseudomonas bharatica CSV86]
MDIQRGGSSAGNPSEAELLQADADGSVVIVVVDSLAQSLASQLPQVACCAWDRWLAEVAELLGNMRLQVGLDTGGASRASLAPTLICSVLI